MLPGTAHPRTLDEIIGMVDALEKRAWLEKLPQWGSKLTGLVGQAATKAKGFIPGMGAKAAPAVGSTGTGGITALNKLMGHAPQVPAAVAGNKWMGRLMGGSILTNLGIQTADQLGSFSNPIKARQEGALKAINSINDLPWYQRMGLAAAPEAALKYRLSTTPTGYMDRIMKHFEDPVTAAAINHIRAPGTPAPFPKVRQFFGEQQPGLTQSMGELAAENERLRALLPQQ